MCDSERNGDLNSVQMMKGNYINRIINSDSRAFDELYNTFKGQFIALFRAVQGVDRESALDLYHRSCAILYNNIETGRLKYDSLPDSKVRAYLNSVGKYVLWNLRRKRQAALAVDTEFVMKFGDLDLSARINGHNVPEEPEEPYDPEYDEKLFIIRVTVENMPHPCARLLNLVIFQKKSHREVADIMNYAGEDTVKTQRHRCMDKLKDKVKERFKAAGYDK